MTIEDNIKLVLRKYPETKYNRAEFFWKYCEQFHGVAIFMMKKQFLEFWENEAAIERKLRDILKLEEFKLQPEQEAKRYEKAAEMKEKYKPIPKETQLFNKHILGE